MIEDIDLFQMASASMSDTCNAFHKNLISQNCQNLTHHCWYNSVRVHLYDYIGMVQAWVAHFVTPLKCMYGKYDWQVMSQKPYKKHKSPSKHDHHGGEAARPSSGVDLMNPCRLRGGRSFQCRRWSNLIDSIIKVEIYLFLLTSCYIEIRLVRRRQW